MRKTIVYLCAAALFASSAPLAAAQDEDDVAAYAAMVFTPIGALPPLVTPAMAGISHAPTRINARYGRISFSDDVGFNNLGVGLDFGRRRGSLGLLVGYAFDDCEGECDGAVMIGGHAEGTLGSTPLGDDPSSATLRMGVRGDVGFARMDDVTALSAVLGVPLAVSMPSGGLRFVPFVTPAFGLGRLSGNDESETGVRFLLGAGVGVVSSTGLMVDLGVQKVFIDDGDAMVGIAVAWNIGR